MYSSIRRPNQLGGARPGSDVLELELRWSWTLLSLERSWTPRQLPAHVVVGRCDTNEAWLLVVRSADAASQARALASQAPLLIFVARTPKAADFHCFVSPFQ